MSAINALNRGELQRGLQLVNRDLVQRTRAATGADSDAMKAAAGVLRTTWRGLVGTRSEEPAAPGQPPLAKSLGLRRSIKFAVVDGVMRVGSGLFTSRLLEFGVTGGDRIIEPRPHARPALEIAAPKMTDVVVADLQRKIATP